MSAASVMKYINKNKYEVVPIGITKDGRWLLPDDVEATLKAGKVEEGAGPAVVLPGDPSWKGLLVLEGGELRPATKGRLDVVFPVLHGTYGEDGTVQGLLELANIPYVGAGVLGSALGMDKALMKVAFERRGLPVVDYLVFLRREWERDPGGVVGMVENRLSYPCFVKPANLGSSVGVSKARDRDQLEEAINLACEYDRKFLVEQGVPARELECSVLGNDEPVASVVGEIVPCNEFYDYRAKYIDGRSELIIPADLAPELAEEVRRLAVEAYLAVDCAGLGRVDFFLTRDTGRIYVNEINTIPGFTHISMYPKLFEAAGISYPELIDRLLELALERHGDRNRSRTSFSVPER